MARLCAFSRLMRRSASGQQGVGAGLVLAAFSPSTCTASKKSPLAGRKSRGVRVQRILYLSAFDNGAWSCDGLLFIHMHREHKVPLDCTQSGDWGLHDEQKNPLAGQVTLMGSSPERG